MAGGILYYLNLNLSMYVRVGYKRSVTSKTKLYVTTVYIHYLYFHKDLHLRCYIRLEHDPQKFQKVSEGGTPMILRKNEKLSLLDALKYITRGFLH